MIKIPKPTSMLILWVVCTVRVEAQESKNVEKEKIQQQVQSVLSHPSFLAFDWSRTLSFQDERTIDLPEENPDHPQGVFRMNNYRVSIWQKGMTPVRVLGTSELRVLDELQKIANQKECEQKALAFLKYAAPWYFDLGQLPDPVVTGPYQGVWNFTWKRYREDETLDARMEAGVRAMDGKVVTFYAGKSQPYAHKIKPSQAKQIAIDWALKLGLVDVKVSDWDFSGSYNVSLTAQNPKTGRVVSTGVSIDRTIGELTSNMHGWSEVTDSKNHTVEDRLPVWTGQGLIFSSLREIQGTPEWARLPEQLLIRQEDGQLFHLTADYEPSRFTSLSGTASWVAMVWHGWSYALNLKNGEYRVLANPKRYLTTPAVRPDGTWAVAAGAAATGSAGLDLMPDSLQREPEMALRGRLLIPNSDENTPVFSPDGQWLYFLKSKEEGEVLSLHRIPASLAQTKERFAIKDEQQQTIVDKLPFPIERLSVAPDGQHLVAQLPLQYLLPQTDPKKAAEVINLDSHIAVIDVSTKKLRELKLPPLKDAEIGGALIKEMQDAWAGPGNDEVTFSGKTIDADKEERRRIYSCRFDGSNLRAWTPKENQPVPAYKFPETQKTAYQLAKEIALAEIEFDDKEKSARR